MAAVTSCSDFRTQEGEICYYFHIFPLYLAWSNGARYHDLSFFFLVFSFKPALPLSSLTLKSLFSSSSFSCKYWICESYSVVSDSLWPHGVYNPWNSPGQNTVFTSLYLKILYLLPCNMDSRVNATSTVPPSSISNGTCVILTSLWNLNFCGVNAGHYTLWFYFKCLTLSFWVAKASISKDIHLK